MADFLQSPIPETLVNQRLIPATTTLTDGANIALDASLGANFVVTINGARTLSAPTNAKAGQRLTLLVTKTGGGDTLAFNAAYSFGGATPSLLAGAPPTPFFFV